MKFSNHKERLILVLLPVIAIILVNPSGEFPLNDDWAYALAAKHFAETGQIVLSKHGAMSLVWQVIYSGLFSMLAGFSFTTLRIFTCCISILGLQIFYSIFNKISQNKTLALLAALTIFFNPIYFNMTFTFMTEIHFLFWFGLSIWFIMNDRLWLASLFAALAFLIRQHGLLIPAAQVLAMAYLHYKENRKISLKELAAILIIPVIAFFAFEYWINYIHGVAPAYLRKYDLLQEFGFAQAGRNLWGSISYLSWFLFPITLILSWNYFTAQRTKAIFCILAVAAICIIVQRSLPSGFGAVLSPVQSPYRIQMPYLSNILYNFGLGPITLTDVYNGKLPPPNPMPTAFWEVITAWVWVSALGFMLSLSKTIRANFHSILLILLVAFEIIISPKKDGGLFDRHTLVYIIPAVAMLVTQNVKITRRMIFAVSAYLVVLGFFCVAGTHDYLAWNRARWTGLNHLLEKNVPTSEIDGGFEYNGWYLSDTFAPQGNYFTYSDEKRFKWVVKDTYRIFYNTKTPLFEGYNVIEEMPYYSWLTFKPMSIIVAKKKI